MTPAESIIEAAKRLNNPDLERVREEVQREINLRDGRGEVTESADDDFRDDDEDDFDDDQEEEWGDDFDDWDDLDDEDDSRRQF